MGFDLERGLTALATGGLSEVVPGSAAFEKISNFGQADLERTAIALSTGGLSEIKEHSDAAKEKALRKEAAAAASLQEKQQALRQVEFDKASEDVRISQTLADRTIARELKQAGLAQEGLERQTGSLARDSALLTSQLQLSQTEAAFATSELGNQDLLLGRAEDRIRRGALEAGRSGEAAAARAANIAAQQGGTSSALQGAAASARSKAAAEASDVLSQLVETGVQRQTIAGKQDILSETQSVTEQQFANQQASVEDARLGVETQQAELVDDIADIEFNKDFTQSETDRSLAFLKETFDLGGDINAAANRLSAQQQANAQNAANTQGFIQGGVQGAALGASVGGPVGAVVGGTIGAALSLI